ncbi:hypothetical protein D3C72_1546410 [compost metagenome]
MKCCTFCSNEAVMLFSHMTNTIGPLCLECYMKLHGACAVCSDSFMPNEVQEDITYNFRAKFISMNERKNIIVCDACYEAIQHAFPEMMA